MGLAGPRQKCQYGRYGRLKGRCEAGRKPDLDPSRPRGVVPDALRDVEGPRSGGRKTESLLRVRTGNRPYNVGAVVVLCWVERRRSSSEMVGAGCREFSDR